MANTCSDQNHKNYQLHMPPATQNVLTSETNEICQQTAKYPTVFGYITSDHGKDKNIEVSYLVIPLIK